MTGTSLDGLDAALVRLEGTGTALTAQFVGLVSRPLGDELGCTLRRLAAGEPRPPIDFLRAARQLGRLHAQAVADLCDQHLPADARLSFVAAHGQTIWHAPQEQLSWQLFDPWPLVRTLNVPVVYDLRQADLIAGGQGAPITPLADWVLYRDADRPRVVVNLGGICNVTVLGPTIQAIHARDLCPCNILLDGVVQRLFPSMRYDDQGRIARRGRVIPSLRQTVVDQVRAITQQHRSLGREQFPDALLNRWVDAARQQTPQPQDIVASFTAAVADLISQAWRDGLFDNAPAEVVLAGGGARNAALVDHLRAKSAAAVRLSDELGIPLEAREAAAFAVLGALSRDGVPITLEQVTGGAQPGVAGAWVYPAGSTP